MPRFLALVNVLGVTYSASALATGFGNHIAIPLMRKALEDLEDKPPAGGAGMPTDDGFVGKGEGWKKLDEAAARNLLETCMKVLFYRDARSLNRVGPFVRSHSNAGHGKINGSASDLM